MVGRHVAYEILDTRIAKPSSSPIETMPVVANLRIGERSEFVVDGIKSRIEELKMLALHKMAKESKADVVVCRLFSVVVRRLRSLGSSLHIPLVPGLRAEKQAWC